MEQQFYKKFGRNIKDLREKAGLTQDQLAKKLDLTRASVSNVEVGKQSVLAHRIPDFARALDVQIADLFPAIPVQEENQLDLADQLKEVAGAIAVQSMVQRILKEANKRRQKQS